jgi:hypothetical protein
VDLKLPILGAHNKIRILKSIPFSHPTVEQFIVLTTFYTLINKSHSSVQKIRRYVVHITSSSPPSHLVPSSFKHALITAKVI